MPLEPPVRVLRLMRRIEMGTKLGIRSLRTGTSDSHARALGSRARVREEARPPSPPYLGGMSDKPGPEESPVRAEILIPTKDGDGQATLVSTAFIKDFLDADGYVQIRDIRKHKKQLKHDAPLRKGINLRLEMHEIMERTGVRIMWDEEAEKMELVGSDEGVAEMTEWFRKFT